MLTRIKVLSKIDDLQDSHCDGCELVDSNKGSVNYCRNKCDIGLKIQELGNKLEEPASKKMNDILKKGENMTTSDIMYLVGKGVLKRRIATSLGIGMTSFQKLIKSIREGLDMTNFEKVKKLAEQGLRAREIIEKTGLGESTVYAYMSRARKKNKGEKQVTTGKNETDQQRKDYKNLYEDMKKDYAKLDKDNSRLSERLKIKENKFNGLRKHHDEIVNKNQQLDQRIVNLMTSSEGYYRRIETLKKKNKELQLRIDELIDESRTKLSEIEKRYKTEKAKHETLLKYVILESGRL